MMMQPATMLSRAEPTRSPWYSPMLMGFIQQVETPPHLPLNVHTVTSSESALLRLGPSLPLICLTTPLCQACLTQKHFLWLSLHLYTLLKTSHASLKMEIWFPLPPKIRKLRALTLMTAIRALQIWSQPSCHHSPGLRYQRVPRVPFTKNEQWTNKQLWLISKTQ